MTYSNKPTGSSLRSSRNSTLEPQSLVHREESKRQEGPKGQNLRIGLASPEQIRNWAERILPNGEIVGRVLKPHTIHYQTHKPEKDGLFCERIFGPIKSGFCSCGKYKGTRDNDSPPFCEQCGVELTESRVRRHRMGYIQLSSPVTHVWYLKNRPSVISHLLEMPLKDVESLVYCGSFIIGPGTYSKFRLLGTLRIGTHERAYKRILTRKRLRTRKHFLQTKNISLASRSVTLEKSQEKVNDSLKLSQRIIIARKRLLRLAAKPILEPKLICNRFYVPWRIALELFLSKWYRDCESREIITGGYGIQRMLINLNLQNKLVSLQKNWERLVEQTEKMWFPVSGKYKNSDHSADIQREKRLIIRSSKIIRDLIQSKTQPEWMVLSVLPVLPPDLRPIVELREGQLITSDLNELYRKVLFRNEDLSIWLSYQGTLVLSGLLARLQRASLQRAVDALLANGMGSSTFRDYNKRAYKSFSALIKGKKGRFRENLLGKRVDYSGRSVIVVGPLLALHECGLPREMALELFQPFIIRELITRQLAPNLRAAKSMIQNKEPIIWKVLQVIVQNRLVLLNRAPTLHRLGIQAFQPVLVGERAILLHPLVCAGFNADFDGDQMAVHVPLSWEAQVEARILMWSPSNLLSPATGRAVAVPSQDMLLGLYVLTLEGSVGIYGSRQRSFVSSSLLFTKNHEIKESKEEDSQSKQDFIRSLDKKSKPIKNSKYSLYPKFIENKSSFHKFPIFYDYDDVIISIHQGHLNLFSFLWLRWEAKYPVISSRKGPIEYQFDSSGNSINIYDNSYIKKNRKGNSFSKYILTTAGRVLFNQQIQQSIQEHFSSLRK
uniref:DNA-directed RNA polymerase subunit beta' n=1 Tax=Staurastrum punctulatum TaxID=102822 RepID=RPOC1_STAPU|nr:beta' subunit of RNA polymerase [Staurastrum punctulatum]Q32RY3.1 RecName: Full=DNA-directed RNA polymerase subunit beta'; AltName: Full=PEP; AltName: Full=Plastid-encoded RNA polymerase subunit beta'; Short=RNA polymerase subunit beta' [Staurastrum punctulatum]AAX45748.1 beta' subunit of RNA polymerase [Staurastrum punctulatum]